MKVGGRVGFNKFEDIKLVYQNMEFPIELALPWKYEELWLPYESQLSQTEEYFRNSGIQILSIHATQGKITKESFLGWGAKTSQFANDLNIQIITIHPDRVRKNLKKDLQKQACNYIHSLREKSTVIFSVETFMDKNRVFTPEEIMEYELPMTLDVSHIHHMPLVEKIISNYSKNITTLHLSAIGNNTHHLPADERCFEIIRLLQKQNWNGNIILEYLPEYNNRLQNDIETINRFIQKGT